MSGLVQRQESTPEALSAACQAAEKHLRLVYVLDAAPELAASERLWWKQAPPHAVIASLMRDKARYEEENERLRKRLNEAERAVRDQLNAARAVLAAHDSQFTERGDE